MTNTPMPLRTHVEVGAKAVIHTDVAYMNVLSIGGTRHSIDFIDKVSGHMRTLNMKSKGKAAELVGQYTK